VFFGSFTDESVFSLIARLHRAMHILKAIGSMYIDGEVRVSDVYA
jgi:hypothetical protein